MICVQGGGKHAHKVGGSMHAEEWREGQEGSGKGGRCEACMQKSAAAGKHGAQDL